METTIAKKVSIPHGTNSPSNMAACSETKPRLADDLKVRENQKKTNEEQQILKKEFNPKAPQNTIVDSKLIGRREKCHEIQKQCYFNEICSSSPNKDDIKKLFSTLDNLGIRVVVKQYNRTQSVDKEERNDQLSTIYSPEDKCHDSVYCKNLFLKDRKDQYYLVIAEESALIDLKLLKQQLNAARNLSFADAEATEEILGLKLGEMNPFVAMRKSTNDVRFILHQSLLNHMNSKSLLAFHPLIGSLEIDVTVDELNVYLDHWGKSLEILEVDKNSKCQMSEKHRQGSKAAAVSDPTDHNSTSASNVEINNYIGVDYEAKTGESFNEDMYKDNRTEIIQTVNDEDNIKNPREIIEDGNTIKVERSLDFTLEANAITDNETSEHVKIQAAKVNQNLGHSQYLKYSSTTNTSDTHIRSGLVRKGQLKSLLKKAESKTDTQNSESYSPKEQEEVDDMEKFNGQKISVPQSEDSKFQNLDGQPQDEHLELSEFSEDKGDQSIKMNIPEDSAHPVLSEINKFYESLSSLNIQYKEVNLWDSTSRDIGPSLGCKCFLLKDRKQNFFLLITHEFYEMDYGRLKKALKPRKKLDQAEPSEILDVLGVQPSRITPFSCTTDRAISRNITVFISDKIRPFEVILCMQHPFISDGRRLIMKSQELQKYLSSFGLHIGNVEEKKWPDKFNWMFSRFTDESKKSSSPSYSEAENGASTNFDSGNDPDLSVFELVEGSTVDPPIAENDSTFRQSEIPNRKSKTYVESRPTSMKTSTLLLHDNKEDPIFKETNFDELKSEKIQVVLEVKDNNVLFTVDGIIEHLKETGIVFKFTTPSDHFVVKSRHREKSRDAAFRNMTSHEIGSTEKSFHPHAHNLLFTEGNQLKQRNNLEVGDEGEGSDNVETCSTTYFKNKDNHYVIVGGESDYITTRRFSRWFDISGLLNICNVNVGDLTTTPFSIAALTTLRKQSDSKMSKKDTVYLILSSTIYMDEETTCIFQLDQKGSVVRMTSLDLEEFAKKSGIEVWYMP